MDTGYAQLAEWLEEAASQVLPIQSELTATRAVGPENGGQGEFAKAPLIEARLASAGLTCSRLDCPDGRVDSGLRPNIVARLPGKTNRTLWLFGHMDVVPAGDPALWEGDPWVVRQEGDFLYGRGVEDNQQAVTSMLLLALGLAALQIKPELGLGLVFMADEECGSKRGLGWILDEAPELFGTEDLYIVPDGGSPDGTEIEIAEKGQLWLRFTVTGRQCHASTPEAGTNAFVAASALVMALQTLSEIFPETDRLFRPPVSTFVPTMHEANVSGVNILPGREVFYMDCRLLPGVEAGAVKARAASICELISERYGVRIDIDVVQEQEATRVSPKSPVIRLLAQAVEEVYGARARTVGIGGATVAALLRQRGLPAVVWSCLCNTCHQPNEKSSITATLQDACVFAKILLSPINA